MQQMRKKFLTKSLLISIPLLAVSVYSAYVFAQETKVILRSRKNAYCSPEDSKCGRGVLVNGVSNDGCSRTFLRSCSGECFWCDPSDNVGRYCIEEENKECGIPWPSNLTISCGPKGKYTCNNRGGHGSSQCCPDYEPSHQTGNNCTDIKQCDGN